MKDGKDGATGATGASAEGTVTRDEASKTSTIVIKNTDKDGNVTSTTATVKDGKDGATSDDFEGVVVHNSVMVEKDMDNNVSINSKRTVGCLHFGRIWVQTGAAAKPAYKEKVYLITDGDEAGKFTTSADSATKVEVNAIFLGETDNGIANAEFRPGAVVKAAEK